MAFGAHAAVDAIVLPKVNRVADFAAVVPLAPQMPRWAIMETQMGVLNVAKIAGFNVLCGLAMGTNDLGARSRADVAPMAASLWRCVLAARCYGRLIVDGVFNAFRDVAGRKAECQHGRDKWFDGKTLIHSDQAAIANRVFAPAAGEIDLAQRQIKAFNAAQSIGPVNWPGRCSSGWKDCREPAYPIRAGFDRQSPCHRNAAGVSMLSLILGVLIWAYSHLMKRVTPGLRAKLGDGPGKGVATLLSVLALYLIVTGYRAADVIVVWSPPAFLQHINNLLMLIAVILLFMQANRGTLRSYLRHPMLTAVKTWALAHLLVNGDLASIILFGGMLAWAVVDVIFINKMEVRGPRPAKGPVVNDVIYVVVCAVVYAGIVWLHAWLGYPAVG